MNDIILKIIPGEYENSDAIEKTVNYIYRTNQAKNLPLFCYGVWPPTYENIIKQFLKSREQHQNPPDRFVWHFTLSFPFNSKNVSTTYFKFADTIAEMFSSDYQVCYAFHTDTANFHFHFIVSACSFRNTISQLDSNKMQQYIQNIMDIAKQFQISLSCKG